MAFANVVLCWQLLSGIGALLVWSDLRRRGLVWLAVGNVVASFVLYNLTLPSDTNIRVDLFLTIPLLIIVLLRAALGRRQQNAPAKKEEER